MIEIGPAELLFYILTCMTMENAEIASTCSSTRLAEKLKKLMQMQEQHLKAMGLDSEEQKKSVRTNPKQAVLTSMKAEKKKKTSLEVKKLCNESPHHPTPMAWVLFETKGTKLSEVSSNAIMEGEPPDDLVMEVKQTQNPSSNHEETANESTNTGAMQVEEEQQAANKAPQNTTEGKHKDHSKNSKNPSQATLTARDAKKPTSAKETQEKNQTTNAKAPMHEEEEEEMEEKPT